MKKPAGTPSQPSRTQQEKRQAPLSGGRGGDKSSSVEPSRAEPVPGTEPSQSRARAELESLVDCAHPLRDDDEQSASYALSPVARLVQEISGGSVQPTAASDFGATAR